MRDCIKQFVKNTQNFLKTNHGFCTMSEFLAKNKTIIMAQPPYSPDLAPADFFLFPKLKTSIKEKRFATIEEIKEKTKQKLLTLVSPTTTAFQKCFDN